MVYIWNYLYSVVDAELPTKERFVGVREKDAGESQRDAVELKN